MTLPSIRARLSRALLGALLGWGVMVVLLVGLVTRDAVDTLLDSTMQEATEILYSLVQPLAQGNEGPLRIMPPSPHDERLVWQVVSSQGHLQARSVRAPGDPLAPLTSEGFSDRSTPDGTAWRVYTIQVDDDGSKLHVAQRTDERQQQKMQVTLVSLGTALLVGLLTSIWLSLRVRHELDPLQRMSDAVRRHDPLAGADLPPATRDELVPMRDAVMALGQRLSQLVERERAFAAHAAHTLRTPLAGMDAQLAAAIRESPPHGVPRLRSAREALARLNHVVVALLHLFRAERDLHVEPIDMAALVARWPVQGLSVTVDQRVPFRADTELVTAALLNLLDNSQRYGAANAVVRVLREGDAVLVRVEDDGPGIALDRLRALQAAIDGQHDNGPAGLGLRLASNVARAHRGRLRLDAGEWGTRVELSFENAETVPAAAARGPADRSEAASPSP